VDVPLRKTPPPNRISLRKTGSYTIEVMLRLGGALWRRVLFCQSRYEVIADVLLDAPPLAKPGSAREIPLEDRPATDVDSAFTIVGVEIITSRRISRIEVIERENEGVCCPNLTGHIFSSVNIKLSDPVTKSANWCNGLAYALNSSISIGTHACQTHSHLHYTGFG
jgi:hypothetical protein